MIPRIGEIFDVSPEWVGPPHHGYPHPRAFAEQFRTGELHFKVLAKNKDWTATIKPSDLDEYLACGLWKRRIPEYVALPEGM